MVWLAHLLYPSMLARLSFDLLAFHLLLYLVVSVLVLELGLVLVCSLLDSLVCLLVDPLVLVLVLVCSLY